MIIGMDLTVFDLIRPHKGYLNLGLLCNRQYIENPKENRLYL